jgi:ubiquitin-conjugating enzyme E2 J1
MQYNVNNPAVKRILREVKEMEAEPSDQYHANPLEDNIFEWHFTIRGPKDTEFEGGLYHGRIILPPEYPFKPPNIVLLNESGRFEVGTKICLSISSYHPEHWQPSWSIRTVLVALISFMPTKGDGAIGAIDMPAKDRKALTLKTPSFLCDKCGKRMCDILTPVEIGSSSQTETPTTTTTTTSTTTTDTTTTTTATTTTPEPAPQPNVVTNTTASSSSNKANELRNETPIYAPLSTPQPIPQVPATSHHIPTQPAAPIAQPVINPPRHTTPVVQHQTLQYVQAQQAQLAQTATNESSGQTTNLDYVILALLVAIIGLLAKKFLGL